MPKSDFHEKIAFHEANKHWLDKSFEISLTILEAIDDKGWNQTQLAEKLGVSRQRVSKMLKGQENFQLSTLVKLEEVLGVEFVQVDGQDFTKKLNCYLTELTEQIVKSASVSKKRKSVFKDPAGYTTEFLYQTQKKVSDVGEAPFSYDLAA